MNDTKESAQPVTNSTVVIGSFDLTLQLPNGNSGAGNPNAVQFHGYIYNQDDEASISERLALFQRCGEREQARLAIPIFENQKKQVYENMCNLKKHYDGLCEEQGRLQAKGKSLPSASKQQMEQIPATLAKFEENLQKADEELKRIIEKAGLKD